MLSFRAPAPDLKSPLLLNKQLTVRPNLIVHRRMVPTGSHLELLCGEICAELVSAIPGMENLSSSPLQFTDGGRGLLVAFDFPAGQDAKVRQFQAMRLDDGLFTTLTLSIDATLLTPELQAHYVQSLSSVSVVEGGL